MKKKLILVLIIFGLLNLSAQVNDHLEPVNGMLFDYDFQVEYHSKIRKILLKGLTDSPHLRFLTLPSFKPTYVLDIDKEFEPDRYFVTFHRSEKKIWYNKEWEKVKIKKYKSELSKKSAEILIELYKEAINQTKYIKTDVIGFDGTNYFFSVFDNGTKTGTVWAPSKNSRMGKLVEISNTVIELVEKGKKVIDFNSELTNRIESLLIELNPDKYSSNNKNRISKNDIVEVIKWEIDNADKNPDDKGIWKKRINDKPIKWIDATINLTKYEPYSDFNQLLQDIETQDKKKDFKLKKISDLFDKNDIEFMQKQFDNELARSWYFKTDKGKLIENPKKDFYSYTKPIFNKTKSFAIIYKEFYCGSVCAYGTIVILKKNGNNWSINRTIRLWIS